MRKQERRAWICLMLVTVLLAGVGLFTGQILRQDDLLRGFMLVQVGQKSVILHQVGNLRGGLHFVLQSVKHDSFSLRLFDRLFVLAGEQLPRIDSGFFALFHFSIPPFVGRFFLVHGRILHNYLCNFKP